LQSDLTDIHARQNASIDSVVAAFESHLKAIVDRAEIAVIAELQKKLATEDGVILRTPANSRLLRKIDDIFLKALDKEGYSRLVSAYVNSFAGQGDAGGHLARDRREVLGQVHQCGQGELRGAPDERGQRD
jgi:hypothetical protein